MDSKRPPSVGAKDLQDFAGLISAPLIAYLQKQNLPRGARTKELTPEQAATHQTNGSIAALTANARATVYQALKKFRSSDYLRWFYEYARYRLGRRHPFLTYAGQRPENGIYELKTDEAEIRIGLAGDWGTGTDEAFKVAELIEAFEPHYTIHLGDVYFVGDPNEVNENFLGVQKPNSSFTPCRWPTGVKGSFALNGNHEMYALGNAYFDVMLPALGVIEDGASLGQKASYFCLRNDDWCILGLDTAYNSIQWPLLEYFVSPSCALPPQIVAWLRSIADSVGDRAVIVLTHHQVLSVYGDCFTKQADQLFSVLDRPVLWFWGHEHRLALYERYESAERGWPAITGRCIGHGGMPIDLPGQPQAGHIGDAEFVDYRIYKNDEKLHVGMNGLTRLTFVGKTLNVDYVDVHGDVVFEETFAAQDGVAVRTGFVNHALAKPGV